MDGDHNSICKFARADGDDYEQVSYNLVELVETATKVSIQQQELASLVVPSTEIQRNYSELRNA